MSVVIIGVVLVLGGQFGPARAPYVAGGRVYGRRRSGEALHGRGVELAADFGIEIPGVGRGCRKAGQGHRLGARRSRHGPALLGSRSRPVAEARFGDRLVARIGERAVQGRTRSRDARGGEAAERGLHHRLLGGRGLIDGHALRLGAGIAQRNRTLAGFPFVGEDRERESGVVLLVGAHPLPGVVGHRYGYRSALGRIVHRIAHRAVVLSGRKVERGAARDAQDGLFGIGPVVSGRCLQHGHRERFGPGIGQVHVGTALAAFVLIHHERDAGIVALVRVDPVGNFGQTRRTVADRILDSEHDAQILLLIGEVERLAAHDLQHRILHSGFFLLSGVRFGLGAAAENRQRQKGEK